MLCQQKTNNFLVLFLILFFSLLSGRLNAAETKWEVAIVFRGESSDQEFQKDIDDNILELARLNPSTNLQIGIYREQDGKSYAYFPNKLGKSQISFGYLLDRQDLNQYKIPGVLTKSNTVDLNLFLKTFYKDPNAKRSLIIYSHGKGAVGLLGLKTKDLKKELQNIPHLNLLWFDACFMANLEFLYELKDVSDYTVASEEAEFSQGQVFQTLAKLPLFSSSKEAALYLARNTIESYSYVKNGVQRNYVSVSSATISVIENKKLETLAQSLKDVSEIVKSVTSEDLAKLYKTLQRTAVMDNKKLIDLGLYLIELRRINKDVVLEKKLTVMIRLLNINTVKALKTNPRVRLISPAEIREQQIVFGFNNWSNGSVSDYEKNPVYSLILKNDQFVLGPNKMLWPSKKTKQNSDLTISPFAPGINIFNYYFIDSNNGKILSAIQSFSRTHDVVESLADSDITPLLYTAYTQQIGSKAERYTGINIAMPGSVPSIDYYELNFNQLAQWLSL